MFDWLRRRGPVIVDAHTLNHAAYETFFVRRASQMMPQWWTALPTYRDIKHGHTADAGSLIFNNMRGCPGLTDFYRHGWVINSWCDIFVERTSRGGIGYETDSSRETDVRVILADGNEAHTHPASQYAGLVDPGQWQHVKIKSPWLIEHRQPLRWMWTQPTWNQGDFLADMIVLPGIVDFSKQHATHINVLIRRSPGDFLIPANTPLVHLAPMTDADIRMRCHYKEPRYQQLSDRSQPFAFQNQYKKRLNLLDKLRQRPRCPFH